ncbi:hypothetical protein F4775DRAFT_569723 [Biscogniauxia sp. FL1348]|nr:hypothetical protein F4775DRAFT_569723 [Biscogniauxia sp. FL1348]
MSYSSSSAFPRQAINLDGPTIPAPAGSVSNLDDPPNGNHVAIPVITVCVVLFVIFYAIRFYAKYLTKKLILADYLTFLAFPLFWVYVYFSYRLTWTSGYLVHMWDVRLRDVPAFSYVCWIATLLYLWIIAFIKCAILLEWTSIFVPDGKRGFFTWACYTTCAAVSALSIIIFIMDLVNCTPFESNWNSLIPGAYCRFSVPQFGVASATTNFTLDLIPLILVQKVIWGLRISWQKKLGVSFIFLIGITGCVASLVRLYYATLFYRSNDTTYYFSILALCSLCETTCANLILCAPFVPKAIQGLQQTKVFLGLKQYMTLKSEPTYVNSSDSFRDSKETRSTKPRKHWFSDSREIADDTVYLEDSRPSLQQPHIAHSTGQFTV